MKAQENIFTILAILLVVFGLIMAFSIYQTLKNDSPAKIKYEYDTLKSYLKLPDDVLNKLLYGTRLSGNLKFIEGAEFENETVFKVRNSGDLPLTGFKVAFSASVIHPVIVPYMLPPSFDGVIILKNKDIDGKGIVTISTDQGVTLQISKP